MRGCQKWKSQVSSGRLQRQLEHAFKDAAYPQKKQFARYEFVFWIVRKICDRVVVNGSEESGAVLTALWERGGFDWEAERIESFTWRFMRNAQLSESQRLTKHSPIAESLEYGEEGWVLPDGHHSSPEVCAQASEARGLLLLLPTRSREALEILIDGGSPLDVATEFGVTPWEAVEIIKQARYEVTRL